jgi:hypothetical protein
MDKRRAAIASKKADQEAAEKSKHPGDRHKREREEVSERNGKTTVKKVGTVRLAFLTICDDISRNFLGG